MESGVWINGMTIRWEFSSPCLLKKKNINLGLHYQILVFTTQLCGSVPWLPGSSEIKLSMLTRLEKVIKPSLNNFCFTNSLSGIVYNWRKFSTIVTLPRSGCPAEITPKARRIIFQEVTKKNSTVAGAALLPQDQGGLPSLTELWMLDYTSKCYRVSACELKLNRWLVRQQDNNPKHTIV